MPGINITLPIQIVLRLTVAARVSESMTLPYIQSSSLAEKTEAPLLPSGYVAFPEYGLAYKLFQNVLTHNEARKMCLKENGQLAVIDSREKVDKMLSHFSIPWSAWVGLGRFHDFHEWTTIDGKSTSDLPWVKGDPRGDYRCVCLWKIRNGLSNYSCDNRYIYLCEIALPENEFGTRMQK